jgi:hypothetical protein
MTLLCSLCFFKPLPGEDRPRPADTIINGQAVCERHQRYVVGGDHAAARTAEQRESRIAPKLSTEAGHRHELDRVMTPNVPGLWACMICRTMFLDESGFDLLLYLRQGLLEANE